MKSINCSEYKKSYLEIIQRKEVFDLEFEKYQKTRKLPEVKSVQEILEDKIAELRDIIPIPFKEAQKIMGRDFLGPGAVDKLLGLKVKIKELPPIMFTRAELELAKNLDMMLVLRVPYDANGSPITIKNLKENLQTEEIGDRFGELGRKKIRLFGQDFGVYKGQYFHDEDILNLGWSLVGKEVISDFRGKNWSEQEEVLKTWASRYGFEKQARRRKPVEIVYDLLLHYAEKNMTTLSLLQNDIDLTSTESTVPGRHIIGIGMFGSGGIEIYGCSSTEFREYMGVCPCID